MISADNRVTSAFRVENELLALEISSPSTSADTVPTTAVETETTVFVSLLT
jgi:hypothetical protein